MDRTQTGKRVHTDQLPTLLRVKDNVTLGRENNTDVTERKVEKKFEKIFKTFQTEEAVPELSEWEERNDISEKIKIESQLVERKGSEDGVKVALNAVEKILDFVLEKPMPPSIHGREDAVTKKNSLRKILQRKAIGRLTLLRE